MNKDGEFWARWKVKLINKHERRTKEIWIHDRIRTHDLPTLVGVGWWGVLYLPSYKNSWRVRPNDVREVMGSILVGESDFFFVPHSCHVDNFTFHIILYVKHTFSDARFGQTPPGSSMLQTIICMLQTIISYHDVSLRITETSSKLSAGMMSS